MRSLVGFVSLALLGCGSASGSASSSGIGSSTAGSGSSTAGSASGTTSSTSSTAGSTSSTTESAHSTTSSTTGSASSTTGSASSTTGSAHGATTAARGSTSGNISTSSNSTTSSSGGGASTTGGSGCANPIAGAIFDDEFNTPDIGAHGDGTTWGYDPWYSPNGADNSTLVSWQVNPEVAGLPADAATCSVAGGLLKMEVKNTPADVPGALVDNQPYLGSWLETHDTFFHTYGYFEARMQAQSGDCLTSAFWMIPEDGTWPPEIDMPEFDTFQSTLVNWGIQDGPNDDNAINLPIWASFDVSSGLHVYAVDWEPDYITFFLDGVQSQQAPTPADHDKDMFLILDIMANPAGAWNCSSGSPGNIDQSLYLDYVRVYPSSPYVNGVTNPDWNDHRTAQQLVGLSGCQ